jgi:probable rRNA maturation factor
MKAPALAAPRLDIDVDVATADWAALPQADAVVRRALEAALADAGLADELPDHGEVALRLTDDEEVRGLNARFRGLDKPTDVLSFPQAGSGGDDSPGAEMLGDIVIAFGVTARDAADEGKPLDEHLAHLVVHGFLHLLGYDHETGEADAEQMEHTERRILASLGIRDPYADRAA